MENKEENIVNVKLIKDGPLQVLNTCTITHEDGTTEIKEKRASFCRCGKSEKMPYCDGAHK
ncbi:MAG: CDGSH iron-sulfur domain-containing protein [Saprospiraceae bacterium]